MNKISILIPTLNAGKQWAELLESVKNQSVAAYKKIIIDSGSSDDTVATALKYGFEVISISKSEFNHGRVRQQLVDLAGDSQICVFLTQDAILCGTDSIKNIVKAFEDDKVGLAYGRQLPHKNARALETHARLFNYPDKSAIRSYAEKDKLGFKVFFCSNSFAAYSVSALAEVGGFPSDSIMGEDAIVAARLLLKDYKIAYVADATVYHSHSYTLKEEYRRYFDTRVFHEQNKWLIDNYGKPTGEGVKYVKSELKFIAQHHPKSLLKLFTSVFAKWMGYASGKYYKKMPVNLLKQLSMHKSYWASAGR